MLCLPFGHGRAAEVGRSGSEPLLDKRARLVPFLEVLAATLHQSLSAKKAVLARESSSLRGDLTSAKALPDLTLSGTWSARRPELAPTQRREQAYSARLTHTLWDFGRTQAELDKADADEQVQALNVSEIEDRLKWQVARAYQSLINAISITARTQQNLRLSEKKLDEIQDNYKHGLRAKVDLVGAEADRATSYLNAARAESEVALLDLSLSALAGLPTVFRNQPERGNTAIAIRGPDQWRNIIAAWPKDVRSASEKKIEAQLDALNVSASAIDASRYPNLGLSVDATRGGSWQETSWVYSGQLALSWEVPWTRQHSLERHILANERRSVEADLENVRRDRRDLMQAAELRIRLAGDLWQASARQLEFREEQFTLTQERYHAGKATILELSNHELELGNARLEQVRIAGTLAASVLDLAEAMGVENLEGVFHDAG